MGTLTRVSPHRLATIVSVATAVVLFVVFDGSAATACPSNHSPRVATAASRPLQVDKLHDARGDAPAKADLTALKVISTTKRFRVTASVRNLRSNGTLVISTGLSGWGYWWTLVSRKGHVHVTVTEVTEVEVRPAKDCTAAKVRWTARQNRVIASLPYVCAGSSPDGGVGAGGAELNVGHATDTIGSYSAPTGMIDD